MMTTGSMTSSVNVMLAEPPELLAQTVNVVSDRFTDGVPQSQPFHRPTPSGRAGSISQVATMPPVLLTVALNRVSPRVPRKLSLKARIATGSTTVMLRKAKAIPPLLRAITV